MKSHRYVFKGIDFLGFIIVLQIHEECFFIGEIPVVSYMVMHFDVVRTVLQRTKLISGKLCVYFTVLLDDLQFFELFEFGVRKNSPVVGQNRPHLGICKHFLLFPSLLHLNLVLHIFADIGKRSNR